MAKRAARLLRNDGGVLTPNDRAKLAQEALKNAQVYNEYVASNSNGLGSGLLGAGTGGGISGLLGNLLGVSPALSTAYDPYSMDPYATNPYAANPFSTNQFSMDPYTAGVSYNNPFYPAYSQYTNAGLYSANPYTAGLYGSNGACSTGNRYNSYNSYSSYHNQRERERERARQHARWEAYRHSHGS